MVLSAASTTFSRSIVARGRLFGARGGSCSCNPCDCNPCRCGDAAFPNPPLWRLSGCAFEQGKAGEIDLAHLVVLSLALPRGDASGSWEEILLLDRRTTPEQQAILMALFEDELDSLPAELGPQPHARRAVYSTNLIYQADATRPHLSVDLTPATLTLVQAGVKREPGRETVWSYDGPVAWRDEFVI